MIFVNTNFCKNAPRRKHSLTCCWRDVSRAGCLQALCVVMFTTVVVNPVSSSTTEWSLLEVQGSLVPPADVDEGTDEVLVGELVVDKPQGKKVPCSLVMGTLSVEGELAKLPKATAVLRRKVAAKKKWREAGEFDQAKLLAKLAVTPRALFTEFPETDSDRELEEAHKFGLVGRHPAEGDVDVVLETMQVLTDRYYFKSKPIRSVPK